MQRPQRRKADQHLPSERRGWSERRAYEIDTHRMRCPPWREQVVQFAARYVFFALGLAFFNLFDKISPAWVGVAWINLAYGVYFLLNTFYFIHAFKHPYSPIRYRLAMWTDIILVSFSVLNDPYNIPPSLLVFIMVVLGNGMRYGMRLFGEALIGSFAAAMVALSMRYTWGADSLSLGVMFLNLFGAIILIYAYILMGRVEASRWKLEQYSRMDALTGVLNRRALGEFADQMFRKLASDERPFAVMFADLDRFKEVNDTQGHVVGDRVLRDIAALLQRSIRSSDIVARYGGDEFVLLLEDMDLDEAEGVAKRIQEEVNRYARDSGLTCSITIGIGQAPVHGDSLDGVLECVDKALYHSKNSRMGEGIQRVDHALELIEPA